MDSKIKTVAMAALVLVVGLAFWFLGGNSGEPADEIAPPADTKTAEKSTRGAVTPTHGGTPAHARLDRAVPDPGEAVDPSRDTGGAAAEELDEAHADAAGEGVPSDDRAAEYVHPPLPDLEARIQAAAVELPEGRKIQGVTILCLTGGADCRVTGVSATPQDLRAFAVTVEEAPATGDEEAAPTVEIHSTESMSSGMTDFEIGVYYP